MSLGHVLIAKETSLVTHLLINDFPAFAVSCTQQLQGFYAECLDDSHSFINQHVFNEHDAVEEPLNAEHSAVLEQESLRFSQEKAILLKQAPEIYHEQLARRLHEVCKERVEKELSKRFNKYCGCIHLKIDHETYTRRWLEVVLHQHPCQDKEQERERILSHSDYGLLTNAVVCSEKKEDERSPYDVYTIFALRSLKHAADKLAAKAVKSILTDHEIKIQRVASFAEAYIASRCLYNGSVQGIKNFISKNSATSGHKRIDSGRYNDPKIDSTQSKIQMAEQQKTFLAIFDVFDAMAKLPQEAAENFSIDPVQVKKLAPKALGELQEMIPHFFVEVDSLYRPLKQLCALPRNIQLGNASEKKFEDYIKNFEAALPVFEKIISFNKRA
jgi:hypothetical protein